MKSRNGRFEFFKSSDANLSEQSVIETVYIRSCVLSFQYLWNWERDNLMLVLLINRYLGTCFLSIKYLGGLA